MRLATAWIASAWIASAGEVTGRGVAADQRLAAHPYRAGCGAPRGWRRRLTTW
jgi:hypothetical protein